MPENNPAHRTQVLELTGPKYVGLCSCGYLGPDRSTHAEAKIDSNEHIVAALRKKTSK